MEKTYAVYTRINGLRNGEPCVKEIMITNVKSASMGGAEHRVLDIHYTISNALAFDMENPVDFDSYARNCSIYDFEDFKRRYNAVIERRQEVINGQYDIIDEYNQEISDKQEKIIELQREIAKLTAEIENNRTNIEFEKNYLNDYCKATGMRNERVEEVVLGLA